MSNIGTIKQLTDELSEYVHLLHILRESIEHVREAIVITDANLNSPGPTILFANKAFEQLSGYSREEVIGKSPRILQGPKTNRPMLERLKNTLRNGESFIGATINYRKDGTEYPISWEITPIKGPDGEVLRYVSVQRLAPYDQIDIFDEYNKEHGIEDMPK